ncbi:SRPBCC family protein [uncultured Cellulomonas sp.]|uniref:SRPBCC family protein n=1 Tax=uncultured Cellulomonas sp. TaxID=189682 RepID=UPI00260DDC8D|nr:SRPBCC family protein [uncultured Cellulomonas sp.]
MAPSGRTGDVVQGPDGVAVVFDREWTNPPADVWSALTDPDRLERWFGRWSGDPTSGTVEVTMTAEEGAPAEPVTIDACERPHRLAVTTGAPGQGWPLDLVLSSLPDGGTRLRFTHRLRAGDDAASIGVGWHYYLDRLDAVVAGRLPTGSWDEYFPALAVHYAAPAGPG